MFESSYLIDPGAHTTRLYDPKTKQILSVRSCRLAKQPQVIGQDALAAAWDKGDHLVYPFDQEKILANPTTIVKSLFSQAPPDRYLLVPGARVLSFQTPDLSLQEEWKQYLKCANLVKVKMIPAYQPVDYAPFFHIHAGASLVHFVMGNGNKVLDYQALDLAGHQMDNAISKEITRVFQVLISNEDACALKEAVSHALSQNRNPILSVVGLNRHNEYVQIQFRAADLWGCMEPILLEIAHQAATFVCQKGPELMEQVLAAPILLSGGFGQCYNFVALLERALHTHVQLCEDPENWVINHLVQSNLVF